MIDPLIEESPKLRERMKPARSRDADNAMLSMKFAGGILIMTGAASAMLTGVVTRFPLVTAAMVARRRARRPAPRDQRNLGRHHQLR